MLKKGDILLRVSDVKMDKLDFDQAMKVLAETRGESIQMTFKRRVSSPSTDKRGVSGGGRARSLPRSGNGNSGKQQRNIGNEQGHGRRRRSSSRGRSRSRSRSRSPTLTEKMLQGLDVMCGGSGNPSIIKEKLRHGGPCGTFLGIPPSSSVSSSGIDGRDNECRSYDVEDDDHTYASNASSFYTEYSEANNSYDNDRRELSRSDIAAKIAIANKKTNGIRDELTSSRVAPAVHKSRSAESHDENMKKDDETCMSESSSRNEAAETPLARIRSQLKDTAIPKSLSATTRVDASPPSAAAAASPEARSDRLDAVARRVDENGEGGYDVKGNGGISAPVADLNVAAAVADGGAIGGGAEPKGGGGNDADVTGEFRDGVKGVVNVVDNGVSVDDKNDDVMAASGNDAESSALIDGVAGAAAAVIGCKPSAEDVDAARKEIEDLQRGAFLRDANANGNREAAAAASSSEYVDASDQVRMHMSSLPIGMSVKRDLSNISSASTVKTSTTCPNPPILPGGVGQYGRGRAALIGGGVSSPVPPAMLEIDPSLSAQLVGGGGKDSVRSQIESMLRQHEPEKVKLLDKLMKKFKGKEEDLLTRLNQRYDSLSVLSPGTRTRSGASGIKSESTRGVKPSGEEGGDDKEGANGKGNVTSTPAPPSSPAKQKGNPVSSSSSGAFHRQDAAVAAAIASKRAIMEAESDEGAAKEQEKKREQGKDVGDGKVNKEATDRISKSDPFYKKISKLVVFVYGPVSSAEHKSRMRTILNAYKSRRLVLLKLLETKAEVKIDNNNKQEMPDKGIPRTISYLSDVGTEDESNEDENGGSSPGKGSPSRSKGAPSPLSQKNSPRKGITRSSNGEDDTISDISAGTAKWARRRSQENPGAPSGGAAAAIPGPEDVSNNSGSKGSSNKENPKNRTRGVFGINAFKRSEKKEEKIKKKEEKIKKKEEKKQRRDISPSKSQRADSKSLRSDKSSKSPSKSPSKSSRSSTARSLPSPKKARDKKQSKSQKRSMSLDIKEKKGKGKYWEERSCSEI